MKPAPRLATLADLTAIRALIPLSVRGLNRGMYTPEQLDASLQHVFGADTQIIRDGTYYVVEEEGVLVACGGCGLGRLLLETCTAAARAAGFRALELGATLPGVALYEACGFREVERVTQPMPGGLSLPVVRMRMEIR